MIYSHNGVFEHTFEINSPLRPFVGGHFKFVCVIVEDLMILYSLMKLEKVYTTCRIVEKNAWESKGFRSSIEGTIEVEGKL